ncbi:hypothetical protein GCM10010207_28940 [Streptomyces atratus]|uniref:hypothetical protein n=1 Tax=Streptomyces atratus TaxID=1893 RepID=UPI00166FE9BB|nr:hypothetical protein [Streptomyces atratus]GGT27523.1 hypothetical protein GCM10010207_28940 [Streptomyces atratus]
MNIPTGFQEPTDHEGAGLDDRGQGPQTITFFYGDEEFTVSGFERSLPELSSVTDRTALVRAGHDSVGTAIDMDSWHAVARGMVAPASAAAQLRSQKGQTSALIEEHVEGATLRSLHTRVWLTELFPGLQPRTGQEALPIGDPEVHGDVGPDGEPHACVVYTYRDLTHLRDHLRQTFTATRRANPNPYDQSILSRRITRAVIAHPGRLEFADGTESIDVLVVRDGITRLTSAWALLTDQETPDPERIAETATRLLLAEKPQRRGATEKPLSQRMALGRQEALAGLRAEFYKGLGPQQPADRSVRLGQTLVVPAQIAVGLRRHGNTGLPPGEIFDDAIRSILAAVHVEFRAWESAAQNVEVGSRALRRVHLGGKAGPNLLDGIVALALGHRPPEDLREIYHDQRIPGTALWRAVYLTHSLTRPEIFDQVKRHAKDIKGTRLMKTVGYAEILGPIIDLPWRGTKSDSLKQARNAWANGGVLTKRVMDSWSPVPCDDFTTLIPLALAGDRDAQQTLAVAGGNALVADKMITRNVGSAVGRTVPWRSDVNQVVAGLAEHEEGLWQLAFAANAFDPDSECANSFTTAQTLGRDQSGMYTVPDVDLEQPDRIRRDRGGVAVQPLTQMRLVLTSDPVRAREREASNEQPENEELSLGERFAIQRRALVQAVVDARTTLNALLTLADEPASRATTLHPFGSYEEWQTLDESVRALESLIYNRRPAQRPTDEEESEEEDY